MTFGPYTRSTLLISEYTRSIFGEMSSIFIDHLGPTQWYTFSNLHDIWIHQSPNCVWVPCSWYCIDERIHYKIMIRIVFNNVCWSQKSGWAAGIIPFHTEMDDHDLILLISHFLTRDLTDTILCHPHDGEYDLIGFRGDLFSKYCPSKTLENKVLVFSIKHHNIFPV